jgi:hypothetical protein
MIIFYCLLIHKGEVTPTVLVGILFYGLSTGKDLKALTSAELRKPKSLVLI